MIGTRRALAAIVVVLAFAAACSSGSSSDDDAASTTTTGGNDVTTPVTGGITVPLTYTFDSELDDEQATTAADLLQERLELAGHPDSTASVTADGSGLDIEVAHAEDENDARDTVDALGVVGTLSFRPVLAATTTDPVTPPEDDDPDGDAVLAQFDGDGEEVARVQVGPQGLDNAAVDSAEAEEREDAWVVRLFMNDDGIDAWNALAEQCKPPTDTCPEGEIAMVLDSVVITSPRIRPNEDEFTPFKASGVIFRAGWFDETIAIEMAAIVTSGPLPSGLTASS